MKTDSKGYSKCRKLESVQSFRVILNRTKMPDLKKITTNICVIYSIYNNQFSKFQQK